MTATADAVEWNTGARKGGRKSTQDKTTEPLSLHGAPRRGWKRCEWFAKKYGRTPSGKGATKAFNVRPWQRGILQKCLPQTGERPIEALVELARGNGKSTLACLIVLYLAFADGEDSPEVLLVAHSERHAKKLLTKIWRMIQLSPELASRCELYKADGRIEIGFNGGAIHALPSTFEALQGWEPSAVVLDEAHLVDEDIYDALVTGMGKREQSFLLIISTPGDSTETLLWQLVEKAREGVSPDGALTVYVTFAADPGCDPTDEAQWRKANPALGDFLFIRGLRNAADKMLPHREHQFRRLHLCQWSGSEDRWLPWEVIDQRIDRDRVLLPRTPVVLGFDGSLTRDATALIACTIPQFTGDTPHLFTLNIWEFDKPGWRVPVDDVDDLVAYAFDTFDVRRMVVDKAHWRSEVGRWRKAYPDRIAEVPQRAAVMVPATDRLYNAFMEGEVTFDGNDRLRAHFKNAVAVAKVGGVMIYKPKSAPQKNSPVGRIDGAVASIMCHDEACLLIGQDSSKTYDPANVH